MIRSKTRQIGTKTSQHAKRTELDVLNKDPNFDYSFRPYKDIEEGGGEDVQGYMPVGSGNSNGETWTGPNGLAPKGGAKQKRYADTILCRRPKELSESFKEEENERYNAQVNLVMTASKRAQGKLRRINTGDQVAEVSQELKGSEYFTQRPGPTEKEISREES